jgi:hypothetical protein
MNFDEMFDPADEKGDKWGHRWLGSQKFRMVLALEL